MFGWLAMTPLLKAIQKIDQSKSCKYQTWQSQQDYRQEQTGCTALREGLEAFHEKTRTQHGP
jgi:hypothetical protein